MAKFTLEHGIESLNVEIQDGKTIRAHITDREVNYLGLPQNYVILEDGSETAEGAFPEESAIYTLEQQAAKKAACGTKKGGTKKGSKPKGK